MNDLKSGTRPAGGGSETQAPNGQGIYAPALTVVFARRGRSYVEAHIARCDDGLYRFALSILTSRAGYGGPITNHDPGHATVRTAEDAALLEALARLPVPWVSDPASFHEEAADLRRRLEDRLRQPLLL